MGDLLLAHASQHPFQHFKLGGPRREWQQLYWRDWSPQSISSGSAFDSVPCNSDSTKAGVALAEADLGTKPTAAKAKAWRTTNSS